jgi:SPP1 family phage portal protein
MNKIELTNYNLITVEDKEKLSEKQIKDIVYDYIGSVELKKLQMYDQYYEAKNSAIAERVRDKDRRDATPNNFVPTAYYANVVDTQAGYLFADVDYLPRTPADEDYAIFLNDVLDQNNHEVKEMKTGIKALAYNKGVELVYTIGDGINEAQIKYTDVDPRSMILIYDKSIEPDLFCGIWVRLSDSDEYDYMVDVIYKDEWRYYYIGENKSKVREDAKELIFKECPVVVYRANEMGNESIYQKILAYIDALDFLITGNANDIDKLAEAILLLTKTLTDYDLKHMEELKTLMDIEPEERAEYLEKRTDPAFREYVSKLLIQEIHKQSHTIDWYSPDSGLSGNVSAKALRTRLFDMDMYSQRIEKVYRSGSEKRVRLINTIMGAKGFPVGEIDIVFNRTKPDDFEDKAPVLNQLTFMSDETKMEKAGLDVEKEKERLEKQKSANMEMFDLPSSEDVEEDEQE